MRFAKGRVFFRTSFPYTAQYDPLSDFDQLDSTVPSGPWWGMKSERLHREAQSFKYSYRALDLENNIVGGLFPY